MTRGHGEVDDGRALAALHAGVMLAVTAMSYAAGANRRLFDRVAGRHAWTGLGFSFAGLGPRRAAR